MSNPENPPAFPNVEPRDPQFSSAQPGMTLRDWFAGQAMSAILSAAPADVLQDVCAGGRGGRPMAYGAYAIADAMLAAREQKE